MTKLERQVMTLESADVIWDDSRRKADKCLVEVLATALAYLEAREAWAPCIMGTPTKMLTVTIGGFVDIVSSEMKRREVDRERLETN